MDRPLLVMAWLHELLLQRQTEGGLRMPAPILSRVYAVSECAQGGRGIVFRSVLHFTILYHTAALFCIVPSALEYCTADRAGFGCAAVNSPRCSRKVMGLAQHSSLAALVGVLRCCVGGVVVSPLCSDLEGMTSIAVTGVLAGGGVSSLYVRINGG
jgi:hypothetical protein